MTIASDRVDPEVVERPRRWNLGYIRRFMITFGVLSSVFDFLTFGVLRMMFNAGPEEFRTGWFVESVVSASLIVLIVRTRHPFYRTMPGWQLLAATNIVAAVAIILPFTPFAPVFGFTTIPLKFLLALAGIVGMYIVSAELAKRWFFRREDKRSLR
jgi:Mg2+-importing ATPase